MPARRRNVVDPLQLRAGDFVVHEQHGVGRYVEMVRRTVNGGDREYVIVEYAPSRKNQPPDRLFVPTDALDQLTRYVGGEAALAVAAWAAATGPRPRAAPARRSRRSPPS